MTIVRVGQTWRTCNRGETESCEKNGRLLRIEVIRPVPPWSIVAGVYAAVGEQAEYPRAEGVPEGVPIYSDYIGLPIAADGTPAYPEKWELVADAPIGDA